MKQFYAELNEAIFECREGLEEHVRNKAERSVGARSQKNESPCADKGHRSRLCIFSFK